MAWTLFFDMYSGGYRKIKPYDAIIIEAPEEEAKKIFYDKFEHDPEWISCNCCGDDYSISEHATLEEVRIGYGIDLQDKSTLLIQKDN